jgi:hypothetical protein
MSVARGYLQNGKSIYCNVTKPMFCTMNFTVDPANGNGLGIRQLKSNGYVENVFMHTTATPGTNNGHLNPNPAAGYILIQFKNNFNYYLGGFSGFVSPLTGSPLTSTTAHLAYVITSLGTTTLAQWQAAGLPPGLTPTLGQSFIATATGALGGTGTVEVPGNSGNTSMEVVGDPNQSIANAMIAPNGGAYLLLQVLTTATLTAPATGTVIGLTAYFDGSSVSVPDAPGQTGL